jgi:hypothetical protein
MTFARIITLIVVFLAIAFLAMQVWFFVGDVKVLKTQVQEIDTQTDNLDKKLKIIADRQLKILKQGKPIKEDQTEPEPDEPDDFPPSKPKPDGDPLYQDNWGWWSPPKN